MPLNARMPLEHCDASYGSTALFGVILLLHRSLAGCRPVKSVRPRLLVQAASSTSSIATRNAGVRLECNCQPACVSPTKNVFVSSHRCTTTQGMALCSTARAIERGCSTITHTTTRTPAYPCTKATTVSSMATSSTLTDVSANDCTRYQCPSRQQVSTTCFLFLSPPKSSMFT